MSKTFEATEALFGRYEAEIRALESRQVAGEASVKGLRQTEQELTSRVADLMAEMQRTRADVEAAQELAKVTLADAQRDAHSIRIAAQVDSEALRNKGLAAVEAAQRAFQGLA